jgi:transposase InsO family protein
LHEHNACKLVLAGAATAAQTTRDAIDAIEDARCQVHDLLGHSLLDDVTCTTTGEITPVIVVSDNGPCFKSAGFARHGTIQIEYLWRALPADGGEMTTMVAAFRRLYTHARPNEAFNGDRPIERYLAATDDVPSDAVNSTVPRAKRADSVARARDDLLGNGRFRRQTGSGGNA